MREILFRGKREDNGEWVEGNLFVPDKPNTPTQICIGTNVIRIAFDIFPKTIGQYTGFTDKNGTKIFEGDILRGRFDDFFPENITQVAVIWYKNGWHISQNGSLPDPIEDIDSQYFCIVGNIHDNPELLEGTK